MNHKRTERPEKDLLLLSFSKLLPKNRKKCSAVGFSFRPLFSINQHRAKHELSNNLQKRFIPKKNLKKKLLLALNFWIWNLSLWPIVLQNYFCNTIMIWQVRGVKSSYDRAMECRSSSRLVLKDKLTWA